jgi:phage tail-like protein
MAASPSIETEIQAPWHVFRFHVGFVREPIRGPGGGTPGGAEDLCEGAFAEVTGLEASMEPKAIKEGGANYGPHQRGGQVSFATVVLKRGITQTQDLWRWWEVFATQGKYAHRMTVRITLQDFEGVPVLRWRLERAMPVKFKTADLNARGTEVGVEELHLAHEGLYFEQVSA